MNDHNETTFYDLAARILSDAVNPLLVPPAVLLLLGWLSRVSAVELGWIAGFSSLFYFVVPLGLAFYQLHNGHITSLDLPEQKSRNRLFFYSVLSATSGSLLLFFYFNALYPFLAMAALVFLLNPLIGFIINFRWKISIHTAALATAGTIFSCLCLFPVQIPKASAGIFSLIILLVLLPLMIWARYQLRLHTFSELIGGALAGVVFTLTEISIMMSI